MYFVKKSIVKLISKNNREHYTREGNKLLLLLLYFSLY